MKHLYLITFCFVLVNLCDCGGNNTVPVDTNKAQRTDSFFKRTTTRAGTFAKTVVSNVARAIKTKKFDDQVGGHADDIFVIDEDIIADDGSTIPAGVLGKNGNGFEEIAVPKVKADPKLVGLVPYYYGIKTLNDGVDDKGVAKTKVIIGMENLLEGYDHDSGVLIDIKFCWRSFLTNNPKDNKKNWMGQFKAFDLAESKHAGNCPKEGCGEKHPPTKKIKQLLAKIKAEDNITIPFPAGRTKIEGQTLKDQLNSQYHFAFRITATKLRNQSKKEQKKLQEKYNFMRKETEILQVLNDLLAQCHVTNPQNNPQNKSSKALLIEKLEVALGRLRESPFFATHETPGSSGYIVCDKNHLDLRFLDWGKSVELDPQYVDHEGMWIPGKLPKGDRADGYFTGIRNLVKLLKEGKIKN